MSTDIQAMGNALMDTFVRIEIVDKGWKACQDIACGHATCEGARGITLRACDSCGGFIGWRTHYASFEFNATLHVDCYEVLMSNREQERP